jgi:hypothetical protein
LSRQPKVRQNSSGSCFLLGRPRGGSGHQRRRRISSAFVLGQYRSLCQADSFRLGTSCRWRRLTRIERISGAATFCTTWRNNRRLTGGLPNSRPSTDLGLLSRRATRALAMAANPDGLFWVWEVMFLYCRTVPEALACIQISG